MIIKKVRKIENILTKIKDIQDPQIEYALIRACAGYPKFAHILRSLSPNQIPEAIKLFDQTIYAALETLLGKEIDMATRNRIGMPISKGGGGIPRAERLGWAAFTAAKFDNCTNVQEILQFNVPAFANTGICG